MEENIPKIPDEGQEEIIQKALSWHSIYNEKQTNLDNCVSARERRERLEDSTKLLTVLRSGPCINRETLIALARVLIIHVCHPLQDKFFVYNCRRSLACLFTTCESQELKDIYQSDLLVKVMEDTHVKVKVIIVEITSDILHMCEGPHLSEWLDILLTPWTRICENILGEGLSSNYTITSQSDMDKSENDGKNMVLASEPKDILNTCVGVDLRAEDICKINCKLIMLWTDIVKKCFLQYNSLKSQLISFLKDVKLVIPGLNKTNNYLELIVFKSTIKLLDAVFDYGQTLAVQPVIHPIFVDIAKSVIDWCKESHFRNLSLSHEKGFGGEMSVSSTVKMWENPSKKQSTSVADENSSNVMKRKLKKFDNSSDKITPPAVSLLRNISLLVFKAAAVVVRFGTDDDRFTSSVMVLNQLDVYMGRYYTPDFHWIPQVFLDQDDSWMEALLTLLDIYLHFQKSESKSDAREEFCSRISPHRQFLWFLHTTNFDHSIVVDLLISPETCFLLYFTKYLKLIQKEWHLFADTHQSMENEFVGKWISVQCSEVQDSGKSLTEDTCLPEDLTDRKLHCFSEGQMISTSSTVDSSDISPSLTDIQNKSKQVCNTASINISEIKTNVNCEKLLTTYEIENKNDKCKLRGRQNLKCPLDTLSNPVPTFRLPEKNWT